MHWAVAKARGAPQRGAMVAAQLGALRRSEHGLGLCHGAAGGRGNGGIAGVGQVVVLACGARGCVGGLDCIKAQATVGGACSQY